MPSLPLWEWQSKAKDQFWDYQYNGGSKCCITSPTGGGKTRLASAIIIDGIKKGMKTVFYVHRNSLLDQTSAVFNSLGLQHGIRASGYKPSKWEDVQISSTHTERSRAFNPDKNWQLHNADIVFFDEIHGHNGDTTRKLIEEHKNINKNSCIIGLTATPIGLKGIFDKLIIAGRNSDLRKSDPKAHVWAREYCPSEIDIAGLKRGASGEYNENDLVKRINVPKIIGQVYEYWQKYNPQQKPALLFAPSVATSKWFVNLLSEKGVKAAHIDGESIYYGELDSKGDMILLETNTETRNELFRKLECGEVKIISNRFVLREGVDLPYVYHGIFATSFGSRSACLQAGGRIIRAHHSLEHVIIQDHGGNCRRHGSLNLDRYWTLDDNESDFRFDEDANKPKDFKDTDLEPIICPKCGAMRLSGPKCWEPECGYQHIKSAIMVIQADGELRPYVEKKQVQKELKSDFYKAYTSLAYASNNSKSDRPMTFKQLMSYAERKMNVKFKIGEDGKGRLRYFLEHDGMCEFLPCMPRADDIYTLSQPVNSVNLSGILDRNR